MASKNKGFADTVALSMDGIMNDEGYKRIFAKPNLVASAPVSESKPEKHAAQEALEALLATSDTLDSMGLSKSAASVLSAASDLIEEIAKQADDANNTLEVSLEAPVEDARSDEQNV